MLALPSLTQRVRAGVGGNLISAAAESPCVLVVGASGAVFGLQGFFIADLIVNFETITRPLLRLLMTVIFFAFFVITLVTGPSSVSHWSHIGGLICGIFPSFLFLPNIKDKRWKAVQRALTRHGAQDDALPADSAGLAQQCAPAPPSLCRPLSRFQHICCHAPRCRHSMLSDRSSARTATGTALCNESRQSLQSFHAAQP